MARCGMLAVSGGGSSPGGRMARIIGRTSRVLTSNATGAFWLGYERSLSTGPYTKPVDSR